MSSTLLPLIQSQFNRYSTLIILVAGPIGNVIILVFFSPRWRNSCAVCLFCAALFNGLNFISNIPTRLYPSFYLDPANYNMDLCRLRFYGGHVWSQIGRYMFALACIDRYILTKQGPRGRFLNRPIVIRSIIGSIIIFWHVASIHLLFLTTIQNNRCGQYNLHAFVYFIYSVVFVSFIAAIIMVTFGFLDFRNVTRLYARIQPTGGADQRNGENNTIYRRDRDLLTMVLAETVVYIITNFPYPIIYLESGISNYMNISKSTLYLKTETLCNTIGVALLYGSNGIAF